jgi:alkylhydroperoxidase family enzyme
MGNISVVGLLRLRVTFGGVPIVLYMMADCRVAKEAEGAVPDEDKKRAAHRALMDRVLNGEGRASAEQRARAFSNDGLAPPLDALIGKVVGRPTQVSEADLTAAKASGFSEDQLFELVVCAAVGQSARLYEAGLVALAEANVKGMPNNAT